MVKKYKSWLIVFLVVAVSLIVRLRLSPMPLERDEGEYAYAGQLMLQGVPPYKLAYNMKLPGTYAAYAVIMAIFGQTPTGIHIGLALVNCASIVLVYLIGRRILDETTGVVAAVTFGLMSLSPSVLGLAAHATHFVTFFALAGTLLLLRTVQNPLSQPSTLNSQPSDRPSTLNSQPSYQPSTTDPQPPKKPSHSQLSTLNSQLARLATSGFLYGLAFLMKQHGVFFGIFGFVYLISTLFFGNRESRESREKRRRSGGSKFKVQSSKFSISSILTFCAAFVLPYALTCLWLWLAGVFPQFWFWTVSYAQKYATTMPVMYSTDMLKMGLRFVIGPYSFFWLLGVAGAVWMWWDERFAGEVQGPKSRVQSSATAKDIRPPATGSTIQHQVTQPSTLNLQPSGQPSTFSGPKERPDLSGNPQLSTKDSQLRHPRFFLLAFLLCSFASISVGFHYRNHYFITLLPAIGLLAGVAVSHAVYLLRRAKSLDLFVALPVPLLFAAGVIWSLAGDGAAWFSLSPSQAHTDMYKTSMFELAANIAKFIRQTTPPNSRIAVIGSEPQIYFLSHRRSVTGYIYTFPLMEYQSLAETMQKQMIAEIETNKPEYVIYVKDELSWLRRPDSIRLIDDWWQSYWDKNLELLDTIPIKQLETQGIMGKNGELAPATNAEGTPKCFLVLKRKV